VPALFGKIGGAVITPSEQSINFTSITAVLEVSERDGQLASTVNLKSNSKALWA